MSKITTLYAITLFTLLRLAGANKREMRKENAGNKGLICHTINIFKTNVLLCLIITYLINHDAFVVSWDSMFCSKVKDRKWNEVCFTSCAALQLVNINDKTQIWLLTLKIELTSGDMIIILIHFLSLIYGLKLFQATICQRKKRIFETQHRG